MPNKNPISYSGNEVRALANNSSWLKTAFIAGREARGPEAVDKFVSTLRIEEANRALGEVFSLI